MRQTRPNRPLPPAMVAAATAPSTASAVRRFKRFIVVSPFGWVARASGVWVLVGTGIGESAHTVHSPLGADQPRGQLSGMPLCYETSANPDVRSGSVSGRYALSNVTQPTTRDTQAHRRRFSRFSCSLRNTSR